MGVITYDEAKETIGTLPSLAPRPNAVNLRALTQCLEQRLETIPAQQSPENGYVGMVMPDEIYALRSNTPWTDWENPGPHPAEAATSVEATNLKTLYDSNKAVYDSDQNVKRAVNDALNIAIPKEFRKPVGNQIGTKVFTVRDDPKQILANLRTKYGAATPADKANNEKMFNQPWNPNEPIEALFDRLEECYVVSIMSKPAFTMEQLIDKAIVAIQRTGLYETALLEWNGFAPEHKTWPELKSHFEEAYELRLTAGQGTSAFHGYVNNAETAADDDSITSIQESLNSIHMANNANYANLQEHLKAARAETAALRAELAATQQTMANFTQASVRAPPPQVPTYVPQYIPAPTNAVPLVPTAPTVQPYGQGYGYGYQGRGRGNRRGGSRGYNRGGYGRGTYVPPATGAVPPVPPPPPNAIPPVPSALPPNQQVQNPAFSNVTKRFNNWNMCSTCGFDVEIWHTSQTCPVKHNNPYHQDGCTRENAQAYIAAGHRICKKAMHKTKLPDNPGPNMA
jgi:hypothetical protein